jgi:DNA mismatch repair protein MutL
MGKIKRLDAATVGRICAGEVVEGPGAIVKELLENALDAGAKNVSVEVEEGGKRLIRVSDDGPGMDEEDLAASVGRYATSKLSCYEELEAIGTFGFRGEALAAVASVAKLELVSAAAKLMVSHGDVGAVEKAGRGQGLTVEVSELFLQVPARRKFLKSDQQCLGEVRKTVIQLAMACPQVGFRLVHEGRVVVETSSWADQSWEAAVRLRLAELLGEGWLAEAIRVEETSELGQLFGYCGPVGLHAPNRIHQHLFVNRRAVTSPLLYQAVGMGYGYRLPEGRFPHCVLYCQMERGQVDVNVHPQKREVRFADGQAVRHWVTRAVDGALERSYAVVAPGFVPQFVPQGEWIGPTTMRESPAVAEQQGLGLDQTPTVHVWGMMGDYAWLDPTVVSAVGVAVVDMRAAYARVLYEGLQGSAEGSSQGLLLPVAVELGRARAIVAKSRLDQLERIGLSASWLGEETLLIDAVPSSWRGSDVAQWVCDLLDQLAHEPDQPVERAACRAALKAPPKWTLQEVQPLVEQLLRCKEPRMSPFGKPTLIVLGSEEIGGYFT